MINPNFTIVFKELTTLLILLFLLFLNNFEDFVEDLEAPDHLAKHNVVVIEPGTFFEGYVELGGVCIFFPCVGHCELIWFIMFVYEVLIGEVLPVNRLPSCPIPIYNITPLNQNTWDAPMDKASLIRKRFSTNSVTFLSSAETSEVFCRLGYIWIEFNLETADIFQFDFNVKKYKLKENQHDNIWRHTDYMEK